MVSESLGSWSIPEMASPTDILWLALGGTRWLAMSALTPEPVGKQTKALAWSSGIAANNHGCFEGANQNTVQPSTASHLAPKQELQEQVRRPRRTCQLKGVFSQGKCALRKKSTAVAKSAFIKVNQRSEHPTPT